MMYTDKQGDSAWADGNLAEAAWHFGDMVKLTNANQLNPGLGTYEWMQRDARVLRHRRSHVARSLSALVRALLYSRVERNVSLSCRPVEMSDRCVSVSVCVCVAKSFSNEQAQANCMHARSLRRHSVASTEK